MLRTIQCTILSTLHRPPFKKKEKGTIVPRYDGRYTYSKTLSDPHESAKTQNLCQAVVSLFIVLSGCLYQ